MSREVFDDSAILKTGGGTLNNVQKAIIGFCIEDANTNYKSIFDFHKNEIDDLKKRLQYLKKFVNSENFGDNSRYDDMLEISFKRNHIKYDVSNESLKKFTRNLINNEIKKIEKLLADYNYVFKYSKDLENSQKFINNVLKELKKIESDVRVGKKSIEDFDELANMYGCAAGGRKIGYEQFNKFLREKHFKSTSPKYYADMCKKVSILRAGLIKRSKELNKSDITLYRYTNIYGIAGMLAGSGIVSSNWLDQQWDKFENQYKCKGKAFSEKDYNEMLAGEIMKLLIKKPIISDKAFLSTSLSEKATSEFGPTKLIIHGRKGKIYGADISKLSGHPSQQEILFIPNQKFRVLKAKDISYTNLGYLFPPCFEIELETI